MSVSAPAAPLPATNGSVAGTGTPSGTVPGTPAGGRLRGVTLLLVIGFLSLVGLAGTTLWLVGQTRDFTDRVSETQRVRALTYQVMSALQDAETGQRGFLLTQERSYLTPYEAGRDALPRLLAELAAQVRTPEGRNATAALTRVAGAKLDELGRTVTLSTNGDTAGALALVRSNRGQELTDEARRIVDEMLERTSRRLDTATARLGENGTRLLVVTALAGLVILLVAGTSTWLFIRHAREINAARRAVELANAGLEHRVAERTADLEAANAEIQRFAYIVSHDLRAPLVNVMGFTAEFEVGVTALRALVDRAEAEAPQLLTDEARFAAREDLPEAVGFIRSATQRMDRLINAILKLSREGRRRLLPERLPMDQVLGNIVESLQHQLHERGAEIRVAGPLPSVTSDRVAVEQLFGNLLDNAVKYLDPARPGRIVVRGRRQSSRRAGGEVVYEIEDNGRGIAERDLERIFELFRRAGAQDQPGEGIGLAHVRALVRRLGGTIACESEPGRGSVFRIVLPEVTLAAPEPELAAEGDQS